MSIRSVQCPGCGATANFPVAMVNVQCPSCQTIWNVNQPSAAQLSPAARKAKAAKTDAPSDSDAVGGAMIVASLVGGAMLMLAIIGIAIVLLNRDSPSSSAAAPVEETIKPLEPEPFRVVNLPESQRQRIYNDYRSVARTTVEKPLAVPQGTKVRKDLEGMLQATYDRELMRFAALHDVTVGDVKEIIKEGDAKVWDDSPRSHAVRDGKRVYAREKSEGWELNKNRKPGI